MSKLNKKDFNVNFWAYFDDQELYDIIQKRYVQDMDELNAGKTFLWLYHKAYQAGIDFATHELDEFLIRQALKNPQWRK